MDFLHSISALFQKGGLVMYPLLACSMLVVAIAVERFSYFRSVQGTLDAIVIAIGLKMDAGEWEDAARICDSSPGAVAKIMAEGLHHLECGRKGLENTLEGTAALAAARLRKRLDYLDTIVTLAPLMGLLGTVTGMINSFSVMNIRTGQPQAITGGVGEALVATATGLCVAIMAMIIHSYFKHWLDSIITEIEQACTYLIGKVDRRLCNETA